MAKLWVFYDFISSPEYAQGELLGYCDVCCPLYVSMSETSEIAKMSFCQLLLVYTLEGTVLI